MKSIIIRNIVINLNKFIYAEQINNVVRVYLTDLPAPHNYTFIRCKNQDDAKEILAYINDQIRLRG